MKHNVSVNTDLTYLDNSPHLPKNFADHITHDFSSLSKSSNKIINYWMFSKRRFVALVPIDREETYHLGLPCTRRLFSYQPQFGYRPAYLISLCFLLHPLD
jgi:hypothetical protein